MRLHGWSGLTRRKTRSSGRANLGAEAVGLGVCVGPVAFDLGSLAGCDFVAAGGAALVFFLTT